MLNIQVEPKHFVIREGFQILLRADAEICLPEGLDRISEYYRRTADACMNWVSEAEGERLRSAYLNLESNRERSRFRACSYRLECRPVWENGSYAAWICESRLTGREGESFARRSAQVWNLPEQTLLPLGQVFRLCKIKARKQRPPFRPDGAYPEGHDVVFFRNSSEERSILEFRAPCEEQRQKEAEV